MPGRKRASVKRAATKPPAPAEQEQEVTGDGTGQALPPARTDRLGRPKRDRRARFN